MEALQKLSYIATFQFRVVLQRLMNYLNFNNNIEQLMQMRKAEEGEEESIQDYIYLRTIEHYNDLNMVKELFIVLFLTLFFHRHRVFSESTGFSLNLVRREFPINERKANDYFPNTIRPKITRSVFLFTIDAKLGTPSTKRTFLFDTGSALTWTQCTPCINCFKQKSPLFDPKKSSSYKKLSPNHSLARFFTKSSNGELHFNITYGSGQSSSGIASVENFIFDSNKNTPESIKELVFGCANNNRANNHNNLFFVNDKISGILGMNRSPLSLIGQIGSKSVRKFSYCLPKLSSSVKTTFLRFGNDVKETSHLQKTGFVSPRNDYSVSLLNISFAGSRLNIPGGTFPSPCILDIGSAASYLKREAYNEVVKAMELYFRRYNLTRVSNGPSSNGDLCYKLRSRLKINYPDMVLYFEGAVFQIVPDKLFRFYKDRFCLALFGQRHVTLLGAYQMQNVRFVFDVDNDKLFFGAEDCSKDKA